MVQLYKPPELAIAVELFVGPDNAGPDQLYVVDAGHPAALRLTLAFEQFHGPELLNA
jgi:hypothetical protein